MTAVSQDWVDPRLAGTDALLKAIKEQLPGLTKLLGDVSRESIYEDWVYRFYHQSFKVYYAQETTRQIVTALENLSPQPLNPWFRQLVAEGTGNLFDNEHNSRWLEVTRPILEAFFHAKFFLEMAVKYGNELQMAPAILPSGWAALLYLYGLR